MPLVADNPSNHSTITFWRPGGWLSQLVCRRDFTLEIYQYLDLSSLTVKSFHGLCPGARQRVRRRRGLGGAVKAGETHTFGDGGGAGPGDHLGPSHAPASWSPSTGKNYRGLVGETTFV